MNLEQAVAVTMRRCRNFFIVSKKTGSFSIESGTLVQAPPHASWIYIRGSAYNDGLYHMDTTRSDFKDEEFEGEVFVLNPPPDFLAICQSIADFTAKNPQAVSISESFGDYSHKRPTGSNGGVLTWTQAYEHDLTPYVRMYSEI